MKVFVMSRQAYHGYILSKGITNDNADELCNNLGIIIISINDTNVQPYLKNSKYIKVFNFDDMSKEDEQFTVRHKAMSKMQASELIDFITEHKDAPMCIVHCAAGISRSGAVGEFINDLYGDTYEKFKRDNPQIFPNPYIRKLLKDTYNEKNK